MERLQPLPDRDKVREQLESALEISQRGGKQHGYAASDAEIDGVIALYDAYDGANGSPEESLEGSDLDAALGAAIQDGYEFTQMRAIELGALEEAAGMLNGKFLDGLDLPSCYRFHHWCVAERERWVALRRRVLSVVPDKLDSEPDRALPYMRAMVSADPLPRPRMAGWSRYSPCSAAARTRMIISNTRAPFCGARWARREGAS